MIAEHKVTKIYCIKGGFGKVFNQMGENKFYWVK
jgi:hypothetical protein